MHHRVLRHFDRTVLAVLAMLFLVGSPLPVSAQSNLDLQALQRSQGYGTGDQGANSSAQVYMPARGDGGAMYSSRLEQLYARRAGTQLTQFGYDTLGKPMAVQIGQAGAVQDDYVLGAGDQILVTLRGQDNSTYSQRVSREGQIVLPRLSPVMAAGRTFGAFRADLQARIAQAFVSTDAFISLGEARQVSVLVAGEVRSPGVRVVSALASPLDAILLSGGINKAGSLRAVVIENNGKTRTVDLYGVLTRNASVVMGSLRDGDHIYVPSIGGTVAIAGHVQHPGIFELPRGATSISAGQVVALAGGVEIAGAYQLSKIELGPDGRSKFVSMPNGGTVRTGEVIFVDVVRDVTSGQVRVAGALQIEGLRSRPAASTVGQLIPGAEDLSSEAYPMFSVIVRRDPRSNARTLVPFSLERVLNNQGDVPLQDYDQVFVFTMKEVRLLAKVASGQQPSLAELGCSIPSQVSVAGLPAVQSTAALPTPPLSTTPVPGLPGGGAGVSLDCPETNLQTQLALLGIQTTATAAASQVNITTGGSQGVAGESSGSSNTLSAAGGSAERSSQVYSTLADTLYGNVSHAPDASGGDTYNGEVRAPTIRGMAERLSVSPEALVHAAKNHLVWVLDSVRDPGPYLGADGSSVASMIQAAGGLQREADLSAVEVTSTQIDMGSSVAHTVRASYKGSEADLRRVSVLPLDVIRLRPVFSDSTNGRISITGEIRYPGTFDVVRGERLSSILERAGGLTGEAYPYGAVFTRQRAKVEEQQGNMRQAKQLEADVATLLSMPSAASAVQGATSYVGNLAQQLRSAPALGRITITADPALLRVKPELDIVVEPGDTLYIPRRPTTVTVSGEVLNPGSFQFRSGLSLGDYLSQSGGATQSSDESRIFVVFPDGTARPARQSWVSVSSDMVPPGSTIIVPRDLRPFDTLQFLRDWSQITSQLAITAASLIVLGR